MGTAWHALHGAFEGVSDLNFSLAGMYEPTEEWLETYTRDYDQLAGNTISNPE